MDTKTFPGPDKGVGFSFYPGEILKERFEILALLGIGGMGEVYRAHDLALRETIALKVVPRQRLTPTALERTRREVRVIRHLSHPGLLRTFDLHESNDHVLLSMEYIEEETLQQHLDTAGPLKEGAIRQMLAGLVEVLSYLHSHGIIHRDIKPSNLFLSNEGHVRLGDFGIVYVETEGNLTATGELIGTPFYMSPEQILGRNLTPASDWYAVGVTLYQALVGAPPFTGTSGEVMEAHLRDILPPITRRRASRALRQLLHGLTLKDQSRRWGQAQVRRYLQGVRLAWLPGQRRKALITAVSILLLTTLAIFVQGIIANPEPTSAVIEGRHVAVHRGNRLLWEKDLKVPIENAVLLDADGDGRKEVLLCGPCDLRREGESFEVPVYEGNGKISLRIVLPTHQLQEVFSSFTPTWGLTVESRPITSPDHEDLVLRLGQIPFFPTLTTLWSPLTRNAYFEFAHAGRIARVLPWQGGVAIHAMAPRYLHMHALAVTGRLRPDLRVHNLLNDDRVMVPSLTAYHLLPIMDAHRVDLDSDGGITIILPEGPRILLPDGRLEGQREGAAVKTIDLLQGYAGICRRLQGGQASEALADIDRYAAEAESFGLEGYRVLFEWLRGEALFRRGDIDGALDHGRALAETIPTYALEARFHAGFYAYLAGRYDEAAESWLKGAQLDGMGAGKIYEAYVNAGFAMLLGSADPATVEQTLDLHATLVPGGIYRDAIGLQKGWIPLLKGDASGAAEILKPALHRTDQDLHAAGYFLAAMAAGTYDPAVMETYLARGARPLFLLYLQALGRGDRETARQTWTLIETRAPHDPDLALAVPLIISILGTNL
ncbi:MAG TPA: serine/threonine-protein kinase [Thermoanaerobaculia bacterium]|nr:serine/threonine-protein kinase [Thermoanaerobaculia bacterium]HUM30766.1 serine/threonine-protein kinase [Thermoanaerobaculia bacterium]HXK69034.1 serine/threonine-protein kinase [Thermoanaerobaculia bacterium]